MPLFKVSAPIEQPEPGPVIHNHYEPGYTGLFVAGVFTALGSLVLGWWFLVFLFSEAGFKRPQEAVAQLIILLSLVSFISWAFVKWVGGLFLTAQERTHEHQQRMEELHIEALRYQAMAQVRQLPSGRMNQDEQEWSRLILAVMSEAYNLAPFKPKAARPWSRERVIEIAANTAPPIKVKHTQAAAVDPWLRSNGIITPDRQINIKDFPALADVQQLLIKLYDRPIKVNTRGLDSIIPGQYEFINER